jgi:hypothetical protein
MKNLPLKAIVFIASLGALTLASSSAAVVYSDDFTANPFTSAWSSTFPDGSYPLMWTGNSNPSGIASSLPANANAHSVYSFSDGTRTMSTTDTSVPAGVTGWTTMTYSLDFQMGGTGGTDNNYIGLLLNRSGNAGLNAAIYTGGSGHIAWNGDYGLVWTTPNLNVAANTWYRFKTTLTLDSGDIAMQSQILDLSNNVLATSPFKDYIASSYLNPNGFQISLSNGGGYWDHASQIDNFVVTAVPEPSTWAMLLGGLGSLIMFRRRRAV